MHHSTSPNVLHVTITPNVLCTIVHTKCTVHHAQYTPNVLCICCTEGNNCNSPYKNRFGNMPCVQPGQPLAQHRMSCAIFIKAYVGHLIVMCTAIPILWCVVLAIYLISIQSWMPRRERIHINGPTYQPATYPDANTPGMARHNKSALKNSYAELAMWSWFDSGMPGHPGTLRYKHVQQHRVQKSWKLTCL